MCEQCHEKHHFVCEGCGYELHRTEESDERSGHCNDCCERLAFVCEGCEERFDRDGSGFVDFDEFCLSMGRFGIILRDEQLASLFQAFDADVFFDDQQGHCESARHHVATGHVPHGAANS